MVREGGGEVADEGVGPGGEAAAVQSEVAFAVRGEKQGTGVGSVGGGEDWVGPGGEDVAQDRVLEGGEAVVAAGLGEDVRA